MGYRSDVKIAMTKESFDFLNEFTKQKAREYVKSNLEQISWANDQVEKGLLANGTVTDSPQKGEVIYSLNYVKWNTWFEDIKWIYQGLSELTSKGEGYILVTIGEDGASTEESNFDIYDRGYDEEEPLGTQNVKPIETELYTKTEFVIE